VAARSKARKRAVDLLYESDLRGIDAVSTLRERVELADPPVNPFTVEVIEGVQRHRRTIDDIIAAYAEGWTLDRMPAVDRAVLRMGCYELLWGSDAPDAVVIDEAVELAKSLSTDDSPRFVNGVLARILRDRAILAPPELAPPETAPPETAPPETAAPETAAPRP
jgi:transcription antitermination protein NusB